MLRHLLQMPWHHVWPINSVTPQNSTASRAVFLIPKISHIIRHCKFVLQGWCFFLKKTQTTCSFQIGTKNPTKKKFVVEPSFFTSWTIANANCTRAHVQENKSIYLGYTKREFIVESSFFTSWTIRSEKCARAHVQENKAIYLSIYLSIWKNFWKRVYIYL